jgi:hypothetical protein
MRGRASSGITSELTYVAIDEGQIPGFATVSAATLDAEDLDSESAHAGRAARC